MTKMIRKWLRTRRYRALARKLRSLSAKELSALGIASAEIDRLAFAAVHAGRVELTEEELAKVRGGVSGFAKVSANTGTGEVKDARDRYANIEVAYLLQTV